jgi:phosphoglycerate dehydrogenase-like enzyme
MGVVVASQFEEEFNEELRALDLRPTVIAAPASQPWTAAAEADVLLVRPTPIWRQARDLAQPEAWPGRLRWVHSASAGVDPYPNWLLGAPIVSCGRGVSSDEIADYVIASIYLQVKNLDAIRVHGPADWKYSPLGRVPGAVVGILGFGAIGKAIAQRAQALGARVVATRRRPLPASALDIELVNSPAEVLAVADHIVLALPATDATRHIVNAELLAHAKPTAHLINVARGSVLDQDALLAALNGGRLGFATLDVTEPEPLPAGHPLWTHPRVRLTPHVSSNHTEVRHVMFEQVQANLRRFVRGEPLAALVDPETGY